MRERLTAMCKRGVRRSVPAAVVSATGRHPEEAGSGAAPQSIAKEPSEARRSGLSPAVMSSWWRTRSRSRRGQAGPGRGSSTNALHENFEVCDLAVQFQVAAREDFREIFVALTGSRYPLKSGRQPGESADQLHAGHVPQLVTQCLGRRDDGCVDEL